jgi:hypothetical protein
LVKLEISIYVVDKSFLDAGRVDPARLVQSMGKYRHAP